MKRAFSFSCPVAQQPKSGLGRLFFLGGGGRFLDHTQLDTSHSVGPLWTSDESVAETSTRQHKHSQETNIHARGGIGTHDPSKRSAGGQRLQ
jgi:hypothetical protein